MSITQTQERVIKASSYDILYCWESPWVKKNTGIHDITSGAELCETVGLFMMDQFREIGINPILYKDDRLIIVNKSPKETIERSSK